MDKAQIQNFWKWFVKNVSQFKSDDADQKLFDQLDQKIQELGEFDWELGELKKEWFFVISPNFNEELLLQTEQIISQAPECPGWIFFSARQKKDWDLIWDMPNAQGSLIKVDARSWEYLLYQFDDGSFDIDISPVGFKGDLETKYVAIDFVLAGILGEREYLSLIKGINLVNKFKGKDQKMVSELKNLEKHIFSLSQKSNKSKKDKDLKEWIDQVHNKSTCND